MMLSRQPERPRSQVLLPIVFHLAMMAMLVAAQILLTPSRLLNADNTWHFRFARDVVDGVPIYWSAVDANRLFPDLLFAMIAYALPGGGDFHRWLYYWYGIVILATYASLAALARSMFDDTARHRAFLLGTVVALMAFLLVAPFWDGWLLNPGNHGTGLPVCFACLALVVGMGRQRRFSPAAAALFLMAAALVVAANRYLTIVFIAPLLVALLVVWLVECVSSKDADETHKRTRSIFPRLAALTAIAGLLGHVGWSLLSAAGWHKLVAPGGMPDLPRSDPIDWAARRLDTFFVQLAATQKETWDVLIAMAVLAIAVAAAVVIVIRAFRDARNPGAATGPSLLALFALASALLALAFEVIAIDSSGTWQFRFQAVSTAFAVVFLASLLPWPAVVLRHHGLVTAAALVAVLAAAGVAGAARKPPVVAQEAFFRTAIAQLEQIIGEHAEAPPPYRGYSEYWVANEVTSRSGILRVETLQPVKPVMEYRFYNNNAARLCDPGYFFVLHNGGIDEPRRATILAALGEPIRTVSTPVLAGYHGVTILFYDPALLKTRIADAAKTEARRLFPDFGC